MLIQEVIADMTAMSVALGMVKTILDSPRNLRRSETVGNAEYGSRVKQLTDVQQSIHLMMAMIRGAGCNQFDIQQLLAGADTLYLLCIRRHYMMLERMGDPQRFVNQPIDDGVHPVYGRQNGVLV